MTLIYAVVSLTLSQAGAQSLSQGRALVKQVYEQKSAKLWAAAGPGLKQQLGSEANVRGFATKLARDFGKEVRVISEGLSFDDDGEIATYRRVAAFSHWARGVEIELSLDEQGRLMGLSARPSAKAAPTTYGTHRAKTALRLPFEGAWYVLWGGRSWQNNRHSAVPDQRYALDLLQLTRSGRTYEGQGTRNEQYAAWGKAVLAAGAGTVVVAEDVVLDNEPGKPRGFGLLYGNHVVIDHGNGEFSLVAHLMHGSLKVKRGDRVASGQVLARTGNSGMSSEPHIHYQLMDKADWRVANGFPSEFQNFQLNDRVVERGEPRRADLIAPVKLEARR